MEILIYISGVLTTVCIVSVIGFIRAYKKYTLLLESNQHISNISSIRNAEVNERLEEIMSIVRIIQKDYVPNGELADKIKAIEGSLGEMQKISARNRSFSEQSKQQLLNDIGQLTNKLNRLGQDPGLQSSYS